jgi:hypothetical protein
MTRRKKGPEQPGPHLVIEVPVLCLSGGKGLGRTTPSWSCSAKPLITIGVYITDLG